MGAELEYVDGIANMFYEGAHGTPWHRDGVKLTPEQQYDFDGSMKRHFNIPIEKRPYFIPNDPNAAPDDRVYAQDDGSYYIWRPDTKKRLGRVGSDYEVVTNAEAFEVLKPLVDERVAALETGGVLRHGADAWLLVRWDLAKFGKEVHKVFNKDGGIRPYATVMTNHSGRTGIKLGHTSIRIVCANTLGAAERESEQATDRWVTVSHKCDAKSKLVEAAKQLFSGVVEQFEVIAKSYRLLMKTRLTDELFTKYVLDRVAPDPKKNPNFNPEAKMAGLVMERVLMKRAELRRLWMEGAGHTGEPTAWYAYNSVVQALDFNRKLWPSRDGSWGTASLLDGQLARTKDAVLDGLTEYAMSC